MKMNYRKLFRILFIFLIVCELIAAFGLSYIDSSELDAARNASPENSALVSLFLEYPIVGGLLLISLLAAYLAGAVGVLRFKYWGRWLYCCSYFLAIVLSMFSGPVIYTGIEMAFWDLVLTANGALIMSMFLQPLAMEFIKKV